MADDKKGGKKGKKAHKNKPTSVKYKHYKMNGDKLTRAPFCPRCGPGVFLANRENRMHCGRCNYTEFGKK